jgi:hypothetical protein
MAELRWVFFDPPPLVVAPPLALLFRTPKISPMFEEFSKFAVENLESLLLLVYGYLFATVWIMIGKCGFKNWTTSFFFF